MSSRARQGHSRAPVPSDTDDDDSNAEDDSDAENDSDAEEDDSNADDDTEEDDSDAAEDDSPPGTPCPTCHRVARGLQAESQSSSRSSSPNDLSDPIEDDSDTSLDLSSLSLGSAADSSVPAIEFRRKNAGPIQRLLIDYKVFDVIRRELPDLQKAGEGQSGYIYILEDENQLGYVKIGMTSKHPLDRSTEIRKCKDVHAELVKDQDFTIVPRCKRVELIIFADLWNERQCFLCKCGTRHNEWFKMSKEEAKLRVRLWQEWIRREPYDSEGELKDEWRNRIEALKRDRSYEETVKAEHASGKWWQSFMEEFPDSTRA